MHKIEPYYRWRELYVAAEDEASPFFQREYSEFMFTDKIYNYYIHPQWDSFGSNTLYLKILFVDYAKQYAIIEMIGEWNDCIGSDVIVLKRNLIDQLLAKGIYKYIMIGDNLLNYFVDDDCYYEEWYEEVRDENGWVAMVNIRDHIVEEMEQGSIHHYLHVGPHLNGFAWRKLYPKHVFAFIKERVEGRLIS